LLPKAASNRAGESYHASDVLDFVKTYGAYLKLPTSFAYASALRFSDVITALLELAEHDPRHKEIVKLFTRRSALILYEPVSLQIFIKMAWPESVLDSAPNILRCCQTMLSAVVQCLPLIKEESSADRRQQLVDICVSAFPDLCPWQVKQALLDTAGGSDVAKRMKDLYYYYLSNLLHPHDGSDAARRDPALVQVSVDCQAKCTADVTVLLTLSCFHAGMVYPIIGE
jgi:hypothetical protein